MATATVDVPELLEGIPEGTWVAISERDNCVIAYGTDLQDVLSISRKKGEELPLMVRATDRDATLLL